MESLNHRNSIIFADKRCLICYGGDDEYNLDKLYDMQVFSVHYLCLITGLDSFASTPNSGLLGYLLEDIYGVYRKYIKKMCTYCGKSGASMECHKCRIRYHLPCGLKNGVRVKMLGLYQSYCKICSIKAFTKYMPASLKEYMCAICHCPGEEDDDLLYWPICCKPKQMLHFDCVKQYAAIAGYLTKCPLCSNKNKFRTSIKRFGVYIPNKDANWLIEQPTTVVTYPVHCSAPVCILNDDTEISRVLTPCLICELRIAHLECTFSSLFVCQDCVKKIWPDISIQHVNRFEANLIDLYPWFFRLIDFYKYGKDLVVILDKIYRLLGRKLGRGDAVTWHDMLDTNSVILIESKVKECYADSIENFKKDKPVAKKIKMLIPSPP